MAAQAKAYFAVNRAGDCACVALIRYAVLCACVSRVAGYAYRYDLSQCLFILWKELGRRMRIYDILPTERGLKAWSEAYEREHMVPSETRSALARLALTHIACRVPPLLGLRSLLTALFVCLMDERLRITMMRPAWAHRSVHAIYGVRAFIRYFCLPRRIPTAYIALQNPPCVAANFTCGVTPSRGVYALEGHMRLFAEAEAMHGAPIGRGMPWTR
ncbi:hypothetical protein B0H11DRAFT_2133091 [Mycena galericulata]|nr:hypothetical protein B0H11DRAFT_2133091 [Mycena galericulata]